MSTSIQCRYQHSDGWHIFSAAALPGLLVASQDPKVAFADLAPAVETLIELDSGTRVSARNEMPLEAFLAEITGAQPQPEQPLVLQDRRLIITRDLAAA